MKKDEAASEKAAEQKSDKPELSNLFNNSGVNIFNSPGLFPTSAANGPKINIEFTSAGLFTNNGPKA